MRATAMEGKSYINPRAMCAMELCFFICRCKCVCVFSCSILCDKRGRHFVEHKRNLWPGVLDTFSGRVSNASSGYVYAAPSFQTNNEIGASELLPSQQSPWLPVTRPAIGVWLWPSWLSWQKTTATPLTTHTAKTPMKPPLGMRTEYSGEART